MNEWMSALLPAVLEIPSSLKWKRAYRMGRMRIVPCAEILEDAPPLLHPAKILSSIADHAIDTVRKWFVSGDSLFQFTGGRMLSSSFPDFPAAFEQKILSYIHRNVREEIEFVVRVLSSYRGQSFLYETCKEIVRALSPEDTLLSNVQIILQSTGVVSGEFGLVE